MKFNPKDLKGLRKILPKSNYEIDEKVQKKLEVDEFRNGISSAKNSRKQPTTSVPVVKNEIKMSIQQSDRKLQQFLERRKKLQEEERLRKLKLQNDQK